MKKDKKEKKYWFSPLISYKAFKAVCDKFPDTGPAPQEGDRMLWEMLRDRQINMGVENSDDLIFITTKPIPKKAIIITTPRKEKIK